MITLVLFSGGLSSALTALKAKELWPNNELHLLFTDTLKEDEDLYRFLWESIRYLKPQQFIYLCHGKNPWQIFRDEKYLGNSRVDPCSRVLKREYAREYIETHYSPDNVQIQLGIHWSEVDRLVKAWPHWKPYKLDSILANQHLIEHFDIRKEWEATTGIKAPRLYDMRFTHNNCGGFCVKAGQKQFKRYYEHFPDKYLQDEQEELELQKIIGDYTILRYQREGVKHRMTLREFRESGFNVDDIHDTGCNSCFLD